MIYASLSYQPIKTVNDLVSHCGMAPQGRRTPAETRMVMTLMSAIRWKKDVVIVNMNIGVAFVYVVARSYDPIDYTRASDSHTDTSWLPVPFKFGMDWFESSEARKMLAALGPVHDAPKVDYDNRGRDVSLPIVIEDNTDDLRFRTIAAAQALSPSFIWATLLRVPAVLLQKVTEMLPIWISDGLAEAEYSGLSSMFQRDDYVENCIDCLLWSKGFNYTGRPL